MDKVIEEYNAMKKKAGYSMDEYVTNYNEFIEFSDCLSDENIEKVMEMLYVDNLNSEEINGVHSEIFKKQYRNVLLLQKEIVLNLDKKLEEKTLNFIRALHKERNYSILNSYFNGLMISFKIAEELNQEFK